MLLYDKIKRNFFSLTIPFTSLFLLLINLSCTSPRQWHIQNTITHSQEYCSKRLILEPLDRCQGIQVELIQDCYEVRTALNCFSLPLTPLEDGSIEVLFDYGDHSEIFVGAVLEGGQKVILSPEGTNKLIELLSFGQSFSIYVGRYQTELTPAKFLELYRA